MICYRVWGSEFTMMDTAIMDNHMSEQQHKNLQPEAACYGY